MIGEQQPARVPAGLPTYEKRILPLANLLITGEDTLSGAAQFETNIGAVGILHDPIVLLEGAFYRVITGRRRVAGARRAGLESLECRVYSSLTEKQRALIILSENMHRGPAWVEEVKALSSLFNERVGMTAREIASALGVSIAKVNEGLKLASLPPVLLEVIVSGEISQDTAKRIARLKKSEQALLMEQVERGEVVTDEGIRNALKGQIDAGLAPLQGMMRCAGTPVTQEPENRVIAGRDYEDMERTTHTWQTYLEGVPGTARARILLKYLEQELSILKRTQKS